MSIIKTKRNHVAAIEPLPTDIAVITRVGVVEVVQPIQKYPAAVSEAKALADHMVLHVDVTPIDTNELLARAGMTPESLVASLSHDERDQLRRDCVAACNDAMRYSDDPELVAIAVETLGELGVTTNRQVQ